MTYNEFKINKDKLKISNKEFADIIGYSESSIKAWNRIGVPKWVDIVMEHLLILKELNITYDKYKINT